MNCYLLYIIIRTYMSTDTKQNHNPIITYINFLLIYLAINIFKLKNIHILIHLKRMEVYLRLMYCVF